MSSISFNGIGSGIPVQQIVEASVAAESRPLQFLQRDRDFAKAQISAYGQLTSRMDALRSAMEKLKGEDKFALLSAKSTNANLFTATASREAGATNGNYAIEVLSEAKNYRFVSAKINNEKNTSGEAVNPLSGTLTISGADVKDANNNPIEGLKDADGNPLTVTIDINSLTDRSLDGVRKAINDDPRLKGLVQANLIQDGDGARLSINTIGTGDESRFTVSMSDNPLDPSGDPIFPADLKSDFSSKDYNPADLQQTSLDARILIEGGIERSSSTNVFNDVVTGVNITLKAGAASSDNKKGTLAVTADTAEIKNRINNFVKAYNDVVIHLNEAKKGPLSNESVLRSIESVLRKELLTPTGEDGDLDNTLSRLGVKTFVERGGDANNPSSRNGTLELDNTTLDKLLADDFDKLAYVFGNEETGYAARFSSLAAQLTSTTAVNGQLQKGLIQSRNEGLNLEVKRIETRIESTEMRLKSFEARLYAQFSSIEGLVANLNSTANYIGQQINALPGYQRKK
ncbi:MAG: flagellar filament capping protein FliD [Marinospirillum sp.]|uniref:flagellar filament capping protein FliD n=1 Tax=Marinospirillum sp. TaxID=2183934 RepID=UPI001A105280|nr:flagellar filament capping protein FliD [Marinospirillum sp.]MBE0507665.1 flagellar filament capping protein FliD [Marinospirillum sp.]